jgi:hypothetical protein
MHRLASKAQYLAHTLRSNVFHASLRTAWTKNLHSFKKMGAFKKPSLLLASPMALAAHATQQKKEANQPEHINFNATNIATYPQFKKAFIDFAQSQVTTNNPETVTALLTLFRLYPSECMSLIAVAKQNLGNVHPILLSTMSMYDSDVAKFYADYQKLMQTNIEQAHLIKKLQETDHEKDSTFANIVAYGIMPTVGHFYQGRPAHELPRTLSEGVISAACTDLTLQGADYITGGYFRCPKKNKNGGNSGYYACKLGALAIKMGTSMLVNQYITEPTVDVWFGPKASSHDAAGNEPEEF